MASTRTKYRELANRIEAEELVRLGKGVYAKPKELEGIEGDFYRATLLCGRQSAICLLSALKYYGLSEQIFGGIWILIPYTKSAPGKKVLKPIRSRRPYWKIGIVINSRYRITDIDRTIVDCFRYQRLIGISTAIDALKKALQEKKTTKNKIFEMAKRLKSERLMRPYLDSL